MTAIPAVSQPNTGPVGLQCKSLRAVLDGFFSVKIKLQGIVALATPRRGFPNQRLEAAEDIPARVQNRRQCV
jgi:hypothetical protein